MLAPPAVLWACALVALCRAAIPCSHPAEMNSAAFASLGDSGPRARSVKITAALPEEPPPARLRRGAKQEKRRVHQKLIGSIASFSARLQVGSATYNLLVDTGSRSTLVGLLRPYKPSNASVDTGETAQLDYARGEVSGKKFLDVIKIGSLSIPRQLIVSATSSKDIEDVDGILGLGPEGVTSEQVGASQVARTVMKNAKLQGLIPANIIGIYLAPYKAGDPWDGMLTLGGIDKSLYVGSVTYVPAITTSSADGHWAIEAMFPVVGKSYTGIVDTGTTMIYLPRAVVDSYFKGTGFRYDSSAGAYRSSKSDAKDLKITFGKTTLTLKAKDTVMPKEACKAFAFNCKYTWSWVTAVAPSDEMDFILGAKFLEHFYSVYDAEKLRVGLAPAARHPTSS